MRLMRRQLIDGVCDCDSCRRRRLWIAVRRAHKIAAELQQMEELDEMVKRAYQGNSNAVVDMIEKYEFAALEHQGGPIMITGCAVCEKLTQDEKCYHCGREPWMMTMKNFIKSRKDLSKFPRYICLPVLHAAAWGGSYDLVEKILKYDCDVNQQDMMGCVALHWVTCNGHTAASKQKQYMSTAELLLKSGADVTIPDNGDKTPIELTLSPCPVFNDMRLTILKHKKKILNENLLQYCQEGNADLAMRMHRAGADLGCGDWLNDTPLHVSVTFGHIVLVERLLEAGKIERRLLSLLDARSVDGLTPIDTAHKWGYRRIASILQRERQEQVLKDMVSRITQDGTTTINAKIPPELRGTLLGHQVAKQLKQQQSRQKRMVKLLRLEQRMNKKGSIEKKPLEIQNKSSQLCVIA
mmetsp:Transcript_10940/g.36977  ORF Transcript_10940/g.36977 Transcript_10940/m.36977 type:complete len:410 (+) Transcript_10940:565-1794(+)